MNLKREFYEQSTCIVARSLLGCILVSEKGGRTSGIIVETEAYLGENDPASHAYRGKTKRNYVMYGEPGKAYVYLAYRMHCMLNVVTEKVGTPGAVLIRALEPVDGIELMKERRHTSSITRLTTGPGNLTKALDINLDDNGLDLTGPIIYIEPGNPLYEMDSSPRFGVKDTRLLRFFMRQNPFVSR